MNKKINKTPGTGSAGVTTNGGAGSAGVSERGMMAVVVTAVLVLSHIL